MSLIGHVDSLWRYPVKSMRGEELDELFIGYAGVYGDRLFAFRSSTAPAGFPYFTGRDERQMIRYRTRFRDPAKAAERDEPAGQAAERAPPSGQKTAARRHRRQRDEHRPAHAPHELSAHRAPHFPTA